MSASPFDKIMSGKSDEELTSIINDKEGYLIEAREAAVRELESRGSETSVVENTFEELKGDIQKESEAVQERKRRKERFFYIPLEAPTVVIFSGVGLYLMVILSLVMTLFSNYKLLFNDSPIPYYIWTFVVHFLMAGLIDAILKGKHWARITYAILFAIGLILGSGNLVIIIEGMVFVNTINVIVSIIELLLIILLFVPQANVWFKTREDRIYQDDLLDDM